MLHFVILGGGAFARETFWHIRGTHPGAEIVFADDVSGKKSLRMGCADTLVVDDWNFPDGFRQFIVGVGVPEAKRALVHKALDAGLKPAPTLVHPRALVQGDDVQVGRGGVIAPGCILTTNIVLGDYVVLNLNTTVGHDTTMGDYATCNPGCQISGNVTLGEGVSLGTGVVVREKIVIASWVSVGAQGCVVKDLTQAGATYAGVPARVLADRG